MSLNTISKSVLALALGAVAVAAWAPWAWWPMALCAYALLFGLVSSTQKPMAAVSLGMLFGFGLHLLGHGWIYTTMAGPAGMGTVPAVMASTVVLLGLALFTALPCALQTMLMGRTSSSLLQATTFASLMTAGEIARALVLERFSSLSLGYALLDTWLAGWAPVMGCYGLSWLGYFIAVVTTQTVFTTRQPAPYRLLGLVPVMACLLIGFGLERVRWTESLATPLRFRLVQPNTEQGRKFDPAYRAHITKQLLALLTAEPAELVVAPETAFPMFWNELPEGALEALQDFAKRSVSNLVFGVATVGGQSEGHNSMVHLGPGTNAVSHYDKIHLFPLGEYVPAVLGWINRGLSIPMQDLSAGAAVQAPFRIVQQHQVLDLGTMICNENMLSDEARRWAPTAHVLINPGNMAWFAGTLAIPQDLQITRMRALEVGRPILRVSNAGESALISASGALAKSLQAQEASSMTGTVTGQTGLTPYVRWGDWPIWAMCLLALAVAVRAPKSSRLRWSQSPETTPRCSQTG